MLDKGLPVVFEGVFSEGYTERGPCILALLSMPLARRTTRAHVRSTRIVLFLALFRVSRFAFCSDCKRGLKGYRQRDASFCAFQGSPPDKAKTLPRRVLVLNPLVSACAFV